MRLWREDRDELEQLARLQTAFGLRRGGVASAPGDRGLRGTRRSRGGIRRRQTATVRRSGPRPARGPRMGELAGRLDAERSLYRGLRPEAHALAAYLSAGVRSLAGDRAPLIVTSTVRDLSYQRLLARDNLYATRATRCIRRALPSMCGGATARGRRPLLSSTCLDRLQSLNLIAWVREPGRYTSPSPGEAVALVPREVHFRHACRLVAQTASRPPPARQPRADRDGQLVVHAMFLGQPAPRPRGSCCACRRPPHDESGGSHAAAEQPPPELLRVQDMVGERYRADFRRPRAAPDRSARTRRRRRTGRGRGRPKAPADRSSRRSRCVDQDSEEPSALREVPGRERYPPPGTATRASSRIARSGRGKRLIAKLHTIAPNERDAKGSSSASARVKRVPG